MLQSTDNGSFVINILDQQHSSWQGTITWLADNKTKTFRSTMELLLLIDEALKGENGETSIDANAPKLRKLPKINVCTDTEGNTKVQSK